MILGTVIGSVWGTTKAPHLSGAKLAIVRTAGGDEVVAVDALNAGEGETVLVAIGSRVRDLVLDASVPTKAVLVAIVDGASA